MDDEEYETQTRAEFIYMLDKQEEELDKYKAIIKEVREMLQKKVDFHKNLDFYEDKELEIQVYLNYVACLQDFDEIVERYKVVESK